jgi:hypothetical protein
MTATGRSRHLADDRRHLTDLAARFAGIFVGVVNAVPVVIFGVAQQLFGDGQNAYVASGLGH